MNKRTSTKFSSVPGAFRISSLVIPNVACVSVYAIIPGDRQIGTWWLGLWKKMLMDSMCRLKSHHSPSLRGTNYHQNVWRSWLTESQNRRTKRHFYTTHIYRVPKCEFPLIHGMSGNAGYWR